ncbi:MAG: hypothetical protein S4CHLAM102_14370 [Chlamydiia bacterium]|nr:hypothetical protein [Chlamydiia bacterium]
MVFPEGIYDEVVWDSPATRIGTGYVEGIRPGPHYQGAVLRPWAGHVLAAADHLNEATRLLEGLYWNIPSGGYPLSLGVPQRQLVPYLRAGLIRGQITRWNDKFWQ